MDLMVKIVKCIENLKKNPDNLVTALHIFFLLIVQQPSKIESVPITTLLIMNLRLRELLNKFSPIIYIRGLYTLELIIAGL